MRVHISVNVLVQSATHFSSNLPNTLAHIEFGLRQLVELTIQFVRGQLSYITQLIAGVQSPLFAWSQGFSLNWKIQFFPWPELYYARNAPKLNNNKTVALDKQHNSTDLTPGLISRRTLASKMTGLFLFTATNPASGFLDGLVMLAMVTG